MFVVLFIQKSAAMNAGLNITAAVDVMLTILNLFLFRDYYKKKEDNNVTYKVEIYN